MTPLPAAQLYHDRGPRLVLDVTDRAQLVAATPEHIPAGRWMTRVMPPAGGSHIHHGDHDQARLITAWLGSPGRPLVVGSLARLDSRLTLTTHDDTVRVEVAYLAGGHVSTGAVTLTAQHTDQWAAWLSAWLDTHPVTPGQLALWGAA